MAQINKIDKLEPQDGERFRFLVTFTGPNGLNTKTVVVKNKFNIDPNDQSGLPEILYALNLRSEEVDAEPKRDPR
jgi:hypothetical protein